MLDGATAKVLGRFSGGSHNKASDFQVIHILSGLMLYPSSRDNSESAPSVISSEVGDK